MSKIGISTDVDEALPKILILTHGYFGQELIKSAEMIMGKIEEISFISLTTDFSIEEYRTHVGNAVEQMNEESIILVDLFGGTPCNTVALLSRSHKLNAIVGVNLSVLIESVLLREQYKGKELCEKVIENTASSIHVLNV